jgi:holo-[acyl-carrier protein] synthase
VIVGVGLDLVRVERIRAARERHGEKFLRRVFTDAEIESCLRREDPDPSLAARFAAKEAGMKALGTGWAQGVGWRDLEVVAPSNAPPGLALSGKAAERAASLGAGRVQVSLTHEAGVAAAVVLVETEERRSG